MARVPVDHEITFVGEQHDIIDTYAKVSFVILNVPSAVVSDGWVRRSLK
jgi:hypothetical protein